MDPLLAARPVRSAARRAPAALLAAFVGSALFLPAPEAGAGGGPGGPGGPPPPRPVRAASVVRETVRDEVNAVGTIEPRLYTKVASRIEGIVDALHVVEGSEVAEQGLLATLDPRPLALARDASEARVEAARQRLRRLEAGEREEDLAQARAAVAEAEARLALARDAAARAKALADPARPVIDPARAEDAAREEAAAQARLEQARAVLARLVAGSRVEDVAEAKAEVARAEAERDLAQWQLDHHVVRSPVAGRVLRTMTEQGQWLGKGDAVCEVMVVSTVLARVGVAERDIAVVEAKADALVALDAWPGREFPGVVARILPGAEAPARTYAVRILLKNEGEGLPRHPIMVGMFVRARIAYGPAREALLVPLDALVSDARGTAVFVVENGAARRRPVRKGPAHGWRVEIEGEGVGPGTTVAVAGLETLRDGDAVSAVAAPPPGPPPTDGARPADGPPSGGAAR